MFDFAKNLKLYFLVVVLLACKVRTFNSDLEEAKPLPPPPPLPTALVVGDYLTCLTFDQGGAKCWGQNGEKDQFSLIGNGRFDSVQSPVDLPLGGRKLKQLALGKSHICGVLENSTLICWGDNASGQLGYGDFTPRLSPPQEPVVFQASGFLGGFLQRVRSSSPLVVKAVALAADVSCAALEAGEQKQLQCWGHHFWDYNKPEDGLQKRDLTLNLDKDDAVQQVGVVKSQDWGCLRTRKGKVACWGKFPATMVGQDDVVYQAPESVSLVVKGSDGKPAVKKAIDLMVGYAHACVVLEDHSAKCWGENLFGQLTNGEKPSKFVSLKAPVDLLLGERVSQLAAGKDFTCAVLYDAPKLKCWGKQGYFLASNQDSAWNLHRYFVSGDGVQFYTNPEHPNLSAVDFLGGVTIKQIAAAGRKTCFILADNSVGCWEWESLRESQRTPDSKASFFRF